MFVKYHWQVRNFKQIRESDNKYFLSNIFDLDLTSANPNYCVAET